MLLLVNARTLSGLIRGLHGQIWTRGAADVLFSFSVCADYVFKRRCSPGGARRPIHPNEMPSAVMGGGGKKFISSLVFPRAKL
jgi:hypothetical protein